MLNFEPPLVQLPVERPKWLSRPFLEYEPPRGNESEEDDAEGRVSGRRKGRGAVSNSRRDREKEVEEHDDDEEEKDDRLYCICKELYDPDVGPPFLLFWIKLTHLGRGR